MMNTKMEINERCFSTPNILLEVRNTFKSLQKVTSEFYFLRMFWKLQIEHNPKNTFVCLIVHKAPVNFPRFHFSVRSGWTIKESDCKLFGEHIVSISTKSLITEEDGRVIIWANNLASYLSMFPDSTACFLCSIQVLEGLNNIPELYEERTPLITPLSVRYLTGNLKSLLDTSTMTDVVLKCVNKCIPAHKCILSSRSPVFKAMLQDDSEESKKDIVEIEDVEPTVFQKLIDYVYTGNIDITDESVDRVYDLLKAADKFCLQPLKERCLIFLKENLKPVNACDILLMSDLNKYPDLKAYVVSYIANRKNFLLSEVWKTFAQKNKTIALDVLSSYVKISELNESYNTIN